jgi:hypothetical protein
MDPAGEPEKYNEQEYQLTPLGEAVLRALFEDRRDRQIAHAGNPGVWAEYFDPRISPEGRVRMTEHEMQDMLKPLLGIEEIPPLIEYEVPPPGGGPLPPSPQQEPEH